MNNMVKKVISLVISVTLVLSFSCEAVRASGMYNPEIKYSDVNEKICKLFDDNIEPTTIFQGLSDNEIEILKNEYTINTASNYFFDEEVLNNPEIKLIDDLANQYYNEYLITGELPDVNQKNIKGVDIMTANAYASNSDIISQIGYTFTVSQIAAQLVAIGQYLGIGAALSFLNLVSLIVGMGILTFSYIAVAYSAVAVGANNLILQWYARSWDQLNSSSNITARVIVEKEQGTQYWVAYLSNYFGLGGITIATKINRKDAVDIIIGNKINPNVFTFSGTLASSICAEASTIGMSLGHDAHTQDGKYPMNMKHFHKAITATTSATTHAFYAY